MTRRVVLLAAAALALAACQQDPRGEVATGPGAVPALALRCAPYVGETPPSVPGATTVGAAEVRSWVRSSSADPRRPVLIDVAGGTTDGSERRTVPGAVWLPGAGVCDREAPQMQKRFEDRVAALTGNDRSRPVVVWCANKECWLSYNAAIRLARAGYSDVRWFRDGNAGWREIREAFVPVDTGWVTVQAAR
ncbi:MAG: rhodanese-like domain-containing protein [Acetobacteraceae bacterium]